jgi:hypothetical protein
MAGASVFEVVSTVGGVATASAAVAALVISSWNTFRIARAERPVEWVINSERSATDSNLWVVALSCAGADAVALGIQYHYAEGLFTYATVPVLPVGEVVKIGVADHGSTDAWIRLSWAHPSDRNRPHTAWFALFPQGRSYDEWIRQAARNPIINWIRANLLRSPVRPGGINGRRSGWPERHLFAKDLRDRKVKAWRPALPYEKPRRRPNF